MVQLRRISILLKRMKTLLSPFHLVVLLINSLKVLAATDQDICSCTPLVYEWKLDFQRKCIPTNITVGPNEGIIEMFCSIGKGPLSNATDFTPIKVTSYQIIELDLELTPLKSEASSDVDLKDGDMVTFASITASEQSFSGGIQVSLFGINSALEQVVLEWLVRYSNLCETVPYNIGDSIGWMVYDNGIPSRPETCLFPSNQPSQSPSMLPTTFESSEPSSSYATTSVPSETPTQRNSNSPSITHSLEPSSTRTQRPSNNPTRQSSLIPTRQSSLIPSVSPTISFSMSYSYSFHGHEDEFTRWLGGYVTEFGQKVKKEANSDED